MAIGDYMMCVYGATYQYVSRLLAKHDNEDFAKDVWGRDERGRTWQLMYFLTKPVEVGRRLSDFGDYLEPERYWGFTRVEDERIGKVASSFGSVDNLISEMLGREAGDLPAPLSEERIRGRRVAESSLLIDRIAHGDIDGDPVLDSEGRRRLALHAEYERKPKNRRRAIEIHGTACKVCGFDFDKVYGREYAESYIEIHHLKPLSEGEGVVDPRTDLVPLCANCHRMAHKRRSSVTPVGELKNLVKAHERSLTAKPDEQHPS
jgi:HNH endonuclease